MKKSIYFLLLTCFIAFAFMGCAEQPSTVNNTQAPTKATNDTSNNSSELDSKKSIETAETEAANKKTVETNTHQSVGYSYFDDAVFVGDSVSLKLSYYVVGMRKTDSSFMGKAKFLTSGGLGSGNALEKLDNSSIHPSYKGKKMLIEDSISTIGAKKAYIMLGMNDVGMYGVTESVNNLSKLIDNIKSKSPSIKIYIQSATPILKGCERGSLTNANLNAYNKALKEFAQSKGYTFLDIASLMKNNDGFLKNDYCSDPEDMGVHFTDDACKIWIDFLLNNTSN